MTLSGELKWRGFVNQTTFNDITELDKTKRKFYWGVDPSAPSMTIGNLAAAMMVKTFIKHGFKPILLVGGATGLIGDPDGKAQERDLKTIDEIAKNTVAIAEQYKQIFNGQDFKTVDNSDWFKNINYIEFLRDIGKHAPMRQMLAREFVQSRLKEGGAGISYAEFSYSLIQGYDFLHLFNEYDVSLQISGADQWGNSIAGVDLIRRKTGKEAHVWTTPLIINKTTGRKFGKTEQGAIWLDSDKTSVYQFYQYWLNVDDEGVEDYIKIYTELDKDEVDSVMRRFNANRAGRIAQKTLAWEVTKIVHGKSRADEVKKITEVLFGQGEFLKLSKEETSLLKAELPTVKADKNDNLSAIVVRSGLADSNSEVNRFIESGGIYVNNVKLTATGQNMLQTGNNLLKRGKNSFAIIEFS